MSQQSPSPDELAPERGGYRYPLFRRNDRLLPPDWSGPVYVWDIDNTYLRTEYANLRDLLRIRFEAPQDKRPVPGAVALLAGLRRRGVDPGPEGERGEGQERPPIYFVSASPTTMRPVLEKRMLIDGVVHDGITFRDLDKLRYLRDIFAYKLVALLTLRREGPSGAEEHLFGDDREHDPWVYATYDRVCAGALRGAELEAHLLEHGARRRSAAYVAALADDLPAHDPVRWVFIRKLGRPPARPPSRRDRLRGKLTGAGKAPPPPPDDARILFADDYAQVAAVLRAAGRIGAHDLQAIAREVRARGLGDEPSRLLALAAPRLPADGVAQARAELEALDRDEPRSAP